MCTCKLRLYPAVQGIFSVSTASEVITKSLDFGTVQLVMSLLATVPFKKKVLVNKKIFHPPPPPLTHITFLHCPVLILSVYCY